MVSAFHHSGWSNVNIGVTLYQADRAHFSVKEMQELSLGFMSIIGRNCTDDLPGWLPCCIICIAPDHDGLEELTINEAFHRMSSIGVGSSPSKLTSGLYTSGVIEDGDLKYSSRIRPTATMFSAVMSILGMVFLQAIPGVTVQIMPIPWNVPEPSSVTTLWTTLSATCAAQVYNSEF